MNSNETTPVVSKVIRTVSMILMHAKVHLDEIAARYLVKKLGEHLFPGVRNARDSFSNNPPKMTPEHLASSKMLAIGCCGDKLDEHQGPTGRKDGTSATLLAAELVGLEKSEQFKYLMPLITEVNFCDTRARVQPTMLAELIKAGHRYLAKGPEDVMKWATDALDALDRQLFFQFAECKGERTLLDIFEQCLKDEQVVFESLDHGQRILAGVRREIKRSMENKPGHLTELANMVLAFQRVGLKTGENLIDWTLFALNSIVADQKEFQSALRLCTMRRPRGLAILREERSEKFFVEVGTPQGSVPIRAMMLHTDNPLAPKAARFQEAGGQQVIIVRKWTCTDKGSHFGVFIDHRFKALRLNDFVAMYRFLELPPEEQIRLTALPTEETEKWWNALQQGGDCSTSHLYFFVGTDGQSAFNGSETHAGVEPSNKSSQVLIDIAQHAFNPELVGRWMQGHGIKVPKAYQAFRNPVPVIERRPTPLSIPRTVEQYQEPVRRSPDKVAEPKLPTETTSECELPQLSPKKWTHPKKSLRVWHNNKRKQSTRSEDSHSPSAE